MTPLGEAPGLFVMAVSGASVLGAVSGLWWFSTRDPRLLRIAIHPLVVAALSVLSAVFETVSWMLAPVVAALVAMALVLHVLGRRPEAAFRTLRLLDLGPQDVRSATVRELMAEKVWVGLGVVVAGLAGILLGAGLPVSWAGLLVATAGVVSRRRPPEPFRDHGVPAPDVHPSDMVVEAGPSTEAATVTLVAQARASGLAAVGVPRLGYLFRALGGWNLGLGLDAEQAAWAGQCARRLGLGDVLAEPAPFIESEAAYRLALCRALARPSDLVVVEAPFRGGPAERRLVARAIVEWAQADRVLVVVPAREDAAPLIRALRSGD